MKFLRNVESFSLCDHGKGTGWDLSGVPARVMKSMSRKGRLRHFRDATTLATIFVVKIYQKNALKVDAMR